MRLPWPSHIGWGRGHGRGRAHLFSLLPPTFAAVRPERHVVVTARLGGMAWWGNLFRELESLESLGVSRLEYLDVIGRREQRLLERRASSSGIVGETLGVLNMVVVYSQTACAYV